MAMPLVSVIIPCYNNADFIKASVDSVLTQDYPNLEVIVVDDGSTDDSLAVLQQYEGNITLISQKNQGAAAARNTGILAAKGDYIAFNDGDDIWLPGKVALQVAYLESHPETGLCFTSWREWDQKLPLTDFLTNLPTTPNPAEPVPDRSGWLYIKLLKMSVVCTITTMIRADIVRTVGLFNVNYIIGEDHDYWIRISRLCKIDKLAGIFAIYRINSNSTTKKVHSHNYRLQVLTAALEKYGLSCPSGESLPQSEANQYIGERHFSYGYNAMTKGYRQKAAAAFKNCILLKHRVFKAHLFRLICSSALLYALFYHNRKQSS